MREILFRGRRIDNEEWVEGLPSYDINGKLEEIEVYRGFCDCNTYEVDPDTVCQYTGLTDKNGRKIFEGDIVKVRFTEARLGVKESFYNYIVKYDEYRAKFDLFGNEELCGRPIFEECSQPIMEVIGNIFDNPELLKGDDTN